MVITHKFHAKPTTYNDNFFHSKKEARFAASLDILKRSGDVLFYLRQIPFHLPGNTKYVCDFQIFWSDGRVEFVDVKGVKTPSYIKNKKQVEALYPIEIREA